MPLSSPLRTKRLRGCCCGGVSLTLGGRARSSQVMRAEELLTQAIEASELSGLKTMGLAQPTEDIAARMLLERLRQKRVRRWGASRRGVMI
jgi:hypothetical protein